MPQEFKPRFPGSEIGKWSALYDYPGEGELIAGPVAAAKKRRYLTFEEFIAIAEWKSPRPRKHYLTNQPSFVEEVTRVALAATTSPRLAIESLTILEGVSWPTASVFLHFCHSEPYPIMDFRALWSLSTEVPAKYSFAFWDEYADYTRAIASEWRVDMRSLDRALWKYSELHQGAA